MRTPSPRPVSAVESSRRWSLDDVAFAVFVAYVVLAFTSAFPGQFALPKLLGLHAYAAFLSARWLSALRKGTVHAPGRALASTTAVLAVWWIVTTLTAQHVPTALFGMRDRYNGLATALAGLAVFFCLATIEATDRQIERRLGSLGAALGAAGAYALLQALGLDPISWPAGRPASTLGHPVVFGAALAMFLPFALRFALDGRSRRARRAWAVVTLVQAVALVLAQARGPWAAAASGLAILGALTPSRSTARIARLAVLTAGFIVLLGTTLAVSAGTRSSLADRISTFTSLSRDPSLRYRAHFCRAALAMLHDHALVGVGWENYGLLYSRYREPPTATLDSDLAPTMVHSGPLQTAVSGGIPALVLQFLFLGSVVAAILRRWRNDLDARQRMLGAAFVASLAVWVVQDLSGWPHVALGALASAIGGLGVCWSLGRGDGPRLRARAGLLLLAAAAALGNAWLTVETWRRIGAESRVFEAQNLDVRRSWSAIQQKLDAAVAVGPDRGWIYDAAARVYLERARAGDPRAYARGVELANAAVAANPLDPYLRVRRAELDAAALERGMLAVETDEARDALAAAKSMTVGSASLGSVESALRRSAAGSRIVWVGPAEAAGFGPRASLVVAGVAPKALPDSRVFLHWRNRTQGTDWTTAANGVVPDHGGDWYAVIPDAHVREQYEIYATAETGWYGPCAYAGNRSISLCAPLSFIGPAPGDPSGTRSLIVAGSAPDAEGPDPMVLRFRNETRRAPWSLRPFRPASGVEGVSYPSDAPGNWYCLIPGVPPGERVQAYIAAPKGASRTCAYAGDGLRELCAPLAWIQPQAMAGFGPPGSLIVAGAMPDGLPRAPVFLHWRDATRRSAWAVETAAPEPDRRGVWYNAIPNVDLDHRYEVAVTSPTSASPTCDYAGDAALNPCP
jgi:O-Antigen ligase